MKILAIPILSGALLFAGCSSGPSNTADDPIAIDILLKPDQVMLSHADEANARLLKNVPDGFRLDEDHAPHISLVQAFVERSQLDRISAAVAKIMEEEKPNSWELEATGYYDIPIAERGLAGIVVHPTEDLLSLQRKLLDAIGPYRSSKATGSAFVPRTDGADIMQPTIDYVRDYEAKGAGEHFNPHVTIGWGTRGYLDSLEHASFDTFSFHATSVAIYQLGEYGTAQKSLWTSATTTPLTFRNDGAAKQAILDFMSKTTTERSADFVQPDARIAVFDNDGTLWSEGLMPPQLAFALMSSLTI